MEQEGTADGGGSLSVCHDLSFNLSWRSIPLLTSNQTKVEGIVTVLLGIACFFCLIDSPRRGTRWLDPDEIRFLELQMFIKQGGKFHEESGFKMRDLKIVLMNWRLYLQAWFLFCQSATSYGKIWRTPNTPNEKQVVILKPKPIKVPNSPCLLSPKLWVSQQPTLNSCPHPLMLSAPFRPSDSLACLTISTGGCHSLPSPCRCLSLPMPSSFLSTVPCQPTWVPPISQSVLSVRGFIPSSRLPRLGTLTTLLLRRGAALAWRS